MDIKLFSLCKQEIPQVELGKKHILNCVRSFFPSTEGFSAFTSQKRMLLAASQSLRAADIVIIAVQNNMYNATKRLLANALDFRMRKDADVDNTLTPFLETGKIKQATFDANIVFPQGAVILPTDDMLNCGFVLSAGAQHIIYLPVESPRADEIVYGSLYDFLASLCETEIGKKGLNSRHKAILKRTTDKLGADGVKVAFSSSTASHFVEQLVSGFSSKNCFSFNAKTIFENITPETIVTYARQTKDEQYSSYGVVFSDIEYDFQSDERILRVAIADDSGTNTYTYFSVSGESDNEFLLNCIDKTMMLLYNHEKLAADTDSAELTTKDDSALRKSLFYVAAGVLGISTVIGALMVAFA